MSGVKNSKKTPPREAVSKERQLQIGGIGNAIEFAGLGNGHLARNERLLGDVVDDVQIAPDAQSGIGNGDKDLTRYGAAPKAAECLLKRTCQLNIAHAGLYFFREPDQQCRCRLPKDPIPICLGQERPHARGHQYSLANMMVRTRTVLSGSAGSSDPLCRSLA